MAGRAARSIAESVADECGSAPDLVMGHSYGGLPLAAAVNAGLLTPALSFDIDAPFASRGGWDRAGLSA